MAPEVCLPDGGRFFEVRAALQQDPDNNTLILSRIYRMLQNEGLEVFTC